MNCSNPVIRPVHKYGVLPGGKVGIISTRYYTCPCGKCVGCLMDEQRDWALRLMLEAEDAQSAWFLTLTYDDDHLPLDKQVDTKEIDKFMKNCRQRLSRICKSKGVVIPRLSFFAVGEYGRQTNRPHYHVMLFGFPIHQLNDMYPVIADIWKKGFVKVQPCNVNTANYICKYMMKIDPRVHVVSSFKRMSRRPALGFTYFRLRPRIIEFLNRPENNGIVLRDGRWHRVPRSIKRKFLSCEKLTASKEKMGMFHQELVDSRFQSSFNDRIRKNRFKEEQILRKLFTRFHDL